MTKIITIEGMSCQNCVKHVTNALNDIKGVTNVKVNLENKQAFVDVTDEVTDDILIEAIDRKSVV